MNAIVERYDADALDYARYWAPVLEATSRRLLDEVAPFVARRPPTLRILDVGSGTGVLAFGAIARWPRAEVIASDAAGGMLDVARRRALEAGFGAGHQLSFIRGPADRLPVPDASVDLVLSSFVLQLVPDRLAALREGLRVLRPGGRLAYVTWLDRDAREPFRPMEEFDEAVLELAIDEPEERSEPHAGDVASAAAAASQLRRAGFRNVTARDDMLTYDWSLESYLSYKIAYDERALISILSDDERRELEANARRRLERLSAADFRWQAPIVFASGERPA